MRLIKENHLIGARLTFSDLGIACDSSLERRFCLCNSLLKESGETIVRRFLYA